VAVFSEAEENVVLLDEYPYVPVVNIDEAHTFILSNLVLKESFNTDLLKVKFYPDYQSVYL
jgi:hypothetical protein